MTFTTKLAASVLIGLMAAPALASNAPSRPIACGSIVGVKSSAERVYLDPASGGGIYIVNVVYIGKKPSNKQLDGAMHNCLGAAAKLDGSKDILASAWYRTAVDAPKSQDLLLHPYGPLAQLVYLAASKSVEVHTPQKAK